MAKRAYPWLTAACVGALVAAGVPAAGALPLEPPGDREVAEARAALETARLSVASTEVRLAELGVELDEAWVAVERAAEAYTRATVDRDEAAAESERLARELQEAEAELSEARARLVRVALKAMRGGGAAEQLRAVLESGGVEELVRSSEALDLVGSRTHEVVETYRASALVAETLRDRAAAAVAAHERAAADAERALTDAEAAHWAAEQRVRDAEAEREVLLRALAEARDTSVEVERRRQERLDQERRDRELRERQREERERADRDRADRDRGGQDREDPAPERDREPASPPSPERPRSTPSPTPSPSPERPRPTPTPSPSPERPRPTPTPTPSPSPSPKEKKDPYGLGTGTSRSTAAQGRKAVEWALKQVGVNYVYGGTGNPGFDCSGLTMRAWEHAGLRLNRTSRDQYKQVLKIRRDQIRPGDLLFWGDNAEENDPDSVTHVAMYIGDGKIVEAPRPGLQVRVVALDGWRMDRIMPYAGRP